MLWTASGVRGQAVACAQYDGAMNTAEQLGTKILVTASVPQLCIRHRQWSEGSHSVFATADAVTQAVVRQQERCCRNCRCNMRSAIPSAIQGDKTDFQLRQVLKQ
jgi:crotonobetainyl-CoA:carnitine CoA-transferase CaiB-like acyl-CoA transferase